MNKTANVKKVTKRDRYETLLTFAEVQADPEMVTFIENEINLLVKKNAAERKPDAKKIAADAALTAEIADVLTHSEVKMTIGDIQKRSGVLSELSNQKMAYLLRSMESAGTVTKTVDKRKAYYSMT